MKHLILQPKNKKVVAVELSDDKELWRNEFDPDKSTSRAKICNRFNLDDATLLSNISAMRARGTAVQIQLAAPAILGTCPVFMRGMHQKDDTAIKLSSIAEALAVSDYPVAEPVIYWDDIEKLCALDIDFHKTEPPPTWRLENILSLLQPVPAWSWVTHGGGLRAVYGPLESLSAAELAAVAALNIKLAEPSCTFELKDITRHPCYERNGKTAGPVHQQSQSSSLGAIARWLTAEVNNEQIKDWLDEHDMEMGKSYPHDKCPIRGGIESHASPVWVGDLGVNCLKCAAEGIKSGSRKPGFFPFTSLCGQGTDNLIVSILKNFTHWEHAKLVFADRLNLTGPITELIYRALLKTIHGDDPRVEKVFDAGHNLLRLDGFWSSSDCSAAYSRDISAILAALPACMYEADGEFKVDQEKVNRFRERADLIEYGYPHITPVFGCSVYHHFLSSGDDQRIHAIVYDRRLRPENMAPYRPVYVPPAKRMPLDEAWAIYEEVFPGLDRNYLRLLIAAKGCSEGGIGLPPFIAVTGPSATGKSATATLAAATCGDNNTEVQWQSNVERFRQSVMEGAARGSYVTCNEFLKDAVQSGESSKNALNNFLTMTPDSVSHKMYIGPVTLGRLPVFTVTEVDLPVEIQSFKQIGRRFIHIPTHEAKNLWKTSLIDSGVYRIELFRISDLSRAAAGNAIISDIIDSYFKIPQPFEKIALELGYNTLEKSENFEDQTWLLKRFFDLVCQAPDLPLELQSRWPGRGWKLIRRGMESDLGMIWAKLCDNEFEAYDRSQRVAEQDWAGVIGVKTPVAVDIRSHGQGTVVLRFRNGGIRSDMAKFNKEILNANVSI